MLFNRDILPGPTPCKLHAVLVLGQQKLGDVYPGYVRLAVGKHASLPKSGRDGW